MIDPATMGRQAPAPARARGLEVLPSVVLVTATALVWLAPPAAHAQRVVRKIGDICPMGYVDMLNGNCSTLGLMRYTVQPTNGQPCLEGWMNVGGGYCRKK
jgi:hypothetical protein